MLEVFFRLKESMKTYIIGTSIKEVAQIIMGQFNKIGKPVKISPGLAKDSVQLDKRNEADNYIMGWWLPKTNLQDGIAKVFEAMKNDRI